MQIFGNYEFGTFFKLEASLIYSRCTSTNIVCVMLSPYLPDQDECSPQVLVGL